ncbi:hypothetical protein CC1G_10788 [Coprinopsis cinerea okayama7|uniref:Uncharacterized protein n=1 Tax=Coprinopsis cinerea (strain Okayama-7 / 130 / ATCC MYA-4618 / FGSC 9003) TaxID=240176 RepID=A8NMH1_COPC7|nr:hypothetical protein CC1G_10788 [Coprinopsis cinerea okayama7\|eukprot:XP_001834914.2 hypothetical protein CC1G_10788 [Coprinopsis cinerea okayama7\
MAVTTRSASSSPKKQKRKPRRSFKRKQLGPATPSSNSSLPTTGAPTPLPAVPTHSFLGPSSIDPRAFATSQNPRNVDPQTPGASSSVPNVGPPPIPSYIPIDPTLLEEDLHRSSTPPSPPQSGQASPGPTEVSVVDDNSERFGTPSSVSESPAGNAGPPTASSGTRKQPSGVNPLYGFVDGAGRGSEEYKIYRTRALEPAYEDQADATANLARWTTDLLTRVESISYRTGCWLYLAVHHPMSRTPFIHFVSKKLRRDAPTEVERLHKEVRQLMTTLTRAQKRSVVEAEIALQEAEARAEEASQRAARAESNLAKLKRKLSLLEAGIAHVGDLDDSLDD